MAFLSGGNPLTGGRCKFGSNTEGAAKSHNLTIDYLGSWNEMDAAFADAGAEYLKLLRATLDARGLHATKLVGGDVHSWVDPMCQTLVNGSDPDLTVAVSAIGKHYPSTTSTSLAVATGKPLWSSEDYAANNHGSGGRCQARIINQNWVNGNMTATISWNLISAYYRWLQWGADGLMTASTPWSGYCALPSPAANPPSNQLPPLLGRGTISMVSPSRLASQKGLARVGWQCWDRACNRARNAIRIHACCWG
jgi:hypothetical protein